MVIKGKWLSGNICLKVALVSVILIPMFMGCAAAPKKFDPNITGPQLIVEPETIRLGVATLVKKTNIVFRGKGFQPEDSVFVKLLNVKKDGEVLDVPIADGDVDAKGEFTAKVDPKVPIVKITEFLRAKTHETEAIIIIHQPPIDTGVYTARAESMEADIKADCKFEIRGPSFGDSFKDFIGSRILGRIVYE
jgi:hypothetical protein